MDLIGHPWGSLWNLLSGPLHSVTVTMATGLMTYVQHNIKTALALMVSLAIFQWLVNRDEDLPLHLVAKISSVTFFMAIVLSMPFYLKFIDLAEHLPAALIAATTNTPVQADWAATNDVAMARSLEPIVRFQAAQTGSIFLHPQRFIAVLLLTADEIATAFAYGVAFFINVFLAWSLALLLGTGPIAGSMWPFPKVRDIAISWLSSIMAIIVQMVVVAAVTTLVTGVQDLIARGLLTLSGDAGNQIGAITVVVAISIALYIMFPILTITAMYQVGKVYNGTVPGALNSMLGVPSVPSSGPAPNPGGATASSGGGGSSSGGSGSFGSSFSSTPVAPPGRSLGRGP